ncbi:hypothetical protein LINPERHAP1_LOCUS3852 [Linum perenne]
MSTRRKMRMTMRV